MFVEEGWYVVISFVMVVVVILKVLIFLISNHQCYCKNVVFVREKLSLGSACAQEQANTHDSHMSRVRQTILQGPACWPDEVFLQAHDTDPQSRRNFIMFTQEGIRAHPGVTSYSNNDECQEQLLKIAKVITRQTSLYCIVCAIFSLLSDGCFHTTQELLGACGLHSPRQLQSALEAMAPMGLIIIERRQSNHYRFSHVAFPLGRP